MKKGAIVFTVVIGLLLVTQTWRALAQTNTFPISGNVDIGATSPTSKLAVNGITQTKEIIVTEQSSDWPDYMFTDKGYRLPEIGESAALIEDHKHLPGIPTADDIERDGQNMGGIQAKLLQKIEEMTLLMIRMNKKIKQLEKENQTLRKEIGVIRQ